MTILCALMACVALYCFLLSSARKIEGGDYPETLIYNQQDATLHRLFISGNCSTCFGWYLHPSSGTHTTVSTASGTCQTVSATCRYRGSVEKSSTIAAVWAPDYGWRYHPKHVEQFPETNKLCNVASCWLYIRIYPRGMDPWTLTLWPWKCTFK